MQRVTDVRAETLALLSLSHFHYRSPFTLQAAVGPKAKAKSITLPAE